MKDIYLTQQYLNDLEKYEYIFDKVLQQNYKPGSKHADNLYLLKIWNELNNTNRNIHWSCNDCVMSFFKDMAKLYYSSKAKQEKEATTKRGRPRKEK